jgi:formate hydrogenlyase subunit 4
MNLLVIFYQFLIVALVAPFAAGLVKFFKARLQGRRGASPFLPYFTILTLLKKQMVISESTSWVFRISPFIVFGTSLFMALVLPLMTANLALVTFSNFIIVAGILILGAIFLVFGGLESASAFGGMGASREMTITALIEPTVLLIFGTLALNSGSTEISNMVLHLDFLKNPFIIPTILALALVALAENARYPVDNPATHLELTMVHEAMVLEYSGPYLALLEYASFLKLTFFSLLVANFIWPIGLITGSITNNFALSLVIAPLILLAKIIVMMFLLALLESTIVKMRFYRIQEYATVAFFLALGGIILTLVNITIL